MSTIEQQVTCSTCPWSKFCITPPVMSKAEVDAKIQGDLDKVKETKDEGALMQPMLSALMFSGKDTECQVCPVFAAKLRESPLLSTKIRELMKAM